MQHMRASSPIIAYGGLSELLPAGLAGAHAPVSSPLLPCERSQVRIDCMIQVQDPFAGYKARSDTVSFSATTVVGSVLPGVAPYLALVPPEALSW